LVPEIIKSECEFVLSGGQTNTVGKYRVHSAACWPQPKRTENAHFGIATDGTNFFAAREEVWE
jgi:hypothetical protein